MDEKNERSVEEMDMEKKIASSICNQVLDVLNEQHASPTLIANVLLIILSETCFDLSRNPEKAAWLMSEHLKKLVGDKVNEGRTC